VISVVAGGIEGRNRGRGRVALGVAFDDCEGGSVEGEEVERVENELL
jgi:hypothetical protein